MSEIGGGSEVGEVSNEEETNEATLEDTNESGASSTDLDETTGVVNQILETPETLESDRAPAQSEGTAVVNQVLETPESMELAQAQAHVEQVYHQTVESVLDKYGDHISAQDRARIEAGVDKIQAIEANSSGRTGRYHFDANHSSIHVVSLDAFQRERTATHETLHSTSFNREIHVPVEGKNGYMVYKTVGTRQSSWFHSNETGENYGYTEHGRGMNEGITTMLTNRELATRSPEKGEAAERQPVYGHATDLCIALEELVGKDAMNNAYFGGKSDELADQVNRMAGAQEFDHLRDCLDRAISDDYAERVSATREAQEILARMDERRSKT